MPFVAPKSTSSNAGASGRTTFRPPWVKDDGAASALKSTVKTSVPWAKKTAEEKEKANGEKPAAATATTTGGLKKTTPAATTAAKKAAEPTTNAKKNAEPAKKTPEPLKKVVEPVKKIVAPVKKTPEPLVKKTSAASAPTRGGAKKKEPTPPSSSEEEETEEEESEEEESEEETEEESEEDDSIEEVLKLAAAEMKAKEAKKKEQEESELKRRFSIEKPKLRPVGNVKRDKSMKKIEDDDETTLFDETEDERETRLRFKLEKPKLRHVKREEKPLPSKSTENVLKMRPTLKKVPKIDELLKESKDEPKPEFKTKQLRKAPSIKREPSIINVPAPPPLPSLVPKAPPPPPPPLGPGGDKRSLSSTQKAVLDKLKTRPRRRPDWSEMMKEVESGRKLRHVECNDRSQPILTCKSMTKVDDKFIYETEKDNSHNKLLKQIQGGIRLKPTKTNDRSRPKLEGLRKFRKQMTIEEQLQKSQSKVNMLGEAPGAASETDALSPATSTIVAALAIDDASGDELDDIDKIRDDLQSTKQMLALELRNREAQERENKKLLAKIATLEAELVREKSREKNLEYGSRIIVATMDPTPASEEAYLSTLKQESEDARKTAKDLETKYHNTGELLDQAKSEIEEQKSTIKMLERKLAQALQGNTTPNANRPQFSFCYSFDDLDDDDTYFGTMENGNDLLHADHYGRKGGGSLNGSRRPSDAHTGRDSSPEFDLVLSESDPDEPEEKKNERRERRLVKEVKILRSKLTKLKVKREAAKKEKVALKQAMKKNHVILKEENKKFKKLEKEVQKMAASMKEEEEDEDADEEKEEEEEAEEEASEEESEEESEESESEESEAETESESEAEDASNADKKGNLEPRVKKHEGRLTAMKKCNVLLQANVDNLQDEISQVRAKAANLQAELDSVLADLGF